jgi:S-adenosylmethionine hydrolase
VSRRHNTISFLTDYGTTDEFVGVVKAVIRDIAPHATVLDLTHEVPPFDVKAGSLALARCISYVPEGIVLAVVDPGVGSDRRAIAVEVAGGAGVLIGPDNGLLAPAVAMAGGAERAVEITNPDYRLVAPGATFDGRDVFGPAAAHLCNGVPLDALGPEVDAALLMPATIPLPREEGDEVIAEVLWVDRFGNCQLNIGPDDLPASWPVSMSLRLPDPHQHGQTVTRSAIRADHFAAIGHGIGVVLDSYGMYAVSLDRRSAADDLGLAPGDQVVLAAGTDDQPGGGPVTTPVNLGR